MLDGKTIFITGGSGSFGHALVRYLLASRKPKKIIVYSRDEHKQFMMARRYDDPRMRFYIGDVRDLSRLELAMREADIVVHAAALKHVPIAEYNPMECIHTNVTGADNVVRAALDCGVDRVIALSTDKACSPLNLYGASKLISDKIFIASNNIAGSRPTRFAVVRYGNVVGSRGSVVSVFKEMIAAGAKSLPITDERMTRFWITLEQGVKFVISCVENMYGGELFVPKIPSMRVVDLARALAPGLPLHKIGIRPGEKLHELMITADDARGCIDLGDRYVVQPQLPFWDVHSYREAGKPVPENFSYSSDSNDTWLSDGELRAMAHDVEP
jgi:UDP-N-acetylglucosamine 4,6-dehydratase/5-epimerase